MINIKSVIIGISGLILTKDEKNLLKTYLPIGIILFSRNIKNNNQVLRLTNEIREVLGFDCLILIDQEGGRVQRLKEPNCPNYPAANFFGELAKKSVKDAVRATYLNYYLLGKDLINIGINVNCAPCLDVKNLNTHEVIGDRAFSSDPKIVSLLGEAACNGLIKSGVLPIIKHIPGHGKAVSDSHLSLPIINDKVKSLEKSDFLPFKNLSDMPMAMTAHILYEDIDNRLPVTQSRLANTFIRKNIKYKGILISDDIEMLALSGSLQDKIKSIYKANYDLILHCSGDLNNTEIVLKNGNFMEKDLFIKIKSSMESLNKIDNTNTFTSNKIELSNILKKLM
ncbi:MAG: beta-N-acetylhexosaminidase [Pelagibacterales bacterium]|nr:beta-N-acetylhexosaminidase [Pelagibacterales bacterium]PPR16460.1 MAG: Beta-hexosaminidase [Alphaproteobacteria bacterium MarineAlpha9_Bin3]|tara:strand:+ start:3593 stop:4609 length:1017 start_codon:yes stop_codon:yes gene_type:complete